jgi:broad specificity phosphatase PhoE
MKFYIIRHGETDWNKQGLVQGRIDKELNATGIEQAEYIIGDFFVDKSIDYIASSPLKRATETLDIIINKNKLTGKVHLLEEFIERDFGYFEGKHADLFLGCTDYSKIEGYEEDHILTKRVIDGLIELTKLDVSNVLLVCHSHVMKMILLSQFNDIFDDLYRLKNCAIVEMEYLEGEFKFIAIH